MSSRPRVSSGCVSARASINRRVTDPIGAHKACLWGQPPPVQRVRANSMQVFTFGSNAGDSTPRVPPMRVNSTQVFTPGLNAGDSTPRVQLVRANSTLAFALDSNAGDSTPRVPPVRANNTQVFAPGSQAGDSTPRVPPVRANSTHVFALGSNDGDSTGSVSSTPMHTPPTPTPFGFGSSMSMVSTVATASQIPKKCARKRAATVTFDCSPTDIDIPEMALIDAGLEIQKELGHGNQSSVHLALQTTTGASCCVKRFTKAGITQSSLEFMKDEYKVMQEIGWHPRLTQAYRMFQDASFFYIELALYQGGDFSDLKQNALRSGLCCDEVWWKTIFRQAMQGLAHLHQHQYTHCDVKEPNLMLKTTEYHEPEVVLIDLGVVQAAGAKRTAVFGTPGYIAPEVWDEKIWKPEGDAFSLGVVILQMLTDRVPNSDHPRCGIFTENTKTFKDVKCATQTRKPDVSSLLEGFSPLLRQLTESLLEKDPAKRPTVLEALIFLQSE